MASRTKNLTMDQGADFIYTTKIYSKKSDITPLSVESSDTANAQIRKSYYHPNAIDTFRIAKNTTDNEVSIYLYAANTANIPAGRYVYDLEYLDSSSTGALDGVSPAGSLKFRALEGVITVTPEATKV